MKISEIVERFSGFFEKLLQPAPVIRPKSSWQTEPFCINHGYGLPGCKKAATHEAFCESRKDRRLKVAIRCCTNPECQERALKKAKDMVMKKT